jgi:hypothetical protein
MVFTYMWPASTAFSLFGSRGQKAVHNFQTVRPTQSPIQMTADSFTKSLDA